MDAQDIVGRRFGQLEVSHFLRKERYKKRYDYIYWCRCDCGTERELKRSNLITGHTTSCGCRKASRPTGPDSPYWKGHGEISGRLWAHIKSHADKRGLDFEITIEEAWALFEQQGGKCALSGHDLSLRTPKNRSSSAAVSASLDRIDNSRGYTLDNVQWLHKDINWMKGRFDQQRFLVLCRAVAGQNPAPARSRTDEEEDHER